jgi:hypothetical protein
MVIVIMIVLFNNYNNTSMKSVDMNIINREYFETHLTNNYCASLKTCSKNTSCSHHVIFYFIMHFKHQFSGSAHKEKHV